MQKAHPAGMLVKRYLAQTHHCSGGYYKAFGGINGISSLFSAMYSHHFYGDYQCHLLPLQFCHLLAGNPRLARHNIHCTLCKTFGKKYFKTITAGENLTYFLKTYLLSKILDPLKRFEIDFTESKILLPCYLCACLMTDTILFLGENNFVLFGSPEIYQNDSKKSEFALSQFA